MNEVRRRGIVLPPVSSPSAFRNETPLFHHTNVPDYELIESNRGRRGVSGHAMGATASGFGSSIKYPHVILGIRVNTLNFHINSWRDWIRDVPSEATAIDVGGRYDRFSILVLLGMSINAWVLKFNITAYSLIKNFKPKNLTPKFKGQEPTAWNSGGTVMATTQGTPRMVDVAQDDTVVENGNDMTNLIAKMDLVSKIPEQKLLESLSDYDNSQGTTSQESPHTRAVTQRNLKKDHKREIQDVAVHSQAIRREESLDGSDVVNTKISNAKQKSNAKREAPLPDPPYRLLSKPQIKCYGIKPVVIWTCVRIPP